MSYELFLFFVFEEIHNCFLQTINFNLEKEETPLGLKM